MNKRYTLKDYCDDLTVGKGILYLKKSKESSFPYFFKRFCKGGRFNEGPKQYKNGNSKMC